MCRLYDATASLLSGTCHVSDVSPIFLSLRYFFPTYENDNLLCQLEDLEASDDEVVEISVT